MKLLPTLLGIFLAMALPSRVALAEHRDPAPAAPSPSAAETEDKDALPTADKSAALGPQLDFDFFAEPSQPGVNVKDAPAGEPTANLSAQANTRRWMLKTHQVLGLATWALMAGTVIVGQLNYNQLYGGGGGSMKWQSPHRALVISTSLAFTAAAGFALLAPTPFKKPLRFDTGLVHRIAVVGATLGILTEMVLGWLTTHRANAGNPRNLRTLAQAHQAVGYSTLGFLTVAGAAWVF